MAFRDYFALRVLMPAILMFGSADAAFAQDAAAGAAIFRRCAICHSNAGKPLVGPYLNGVVGRKAGTIAKFGYSKAFRGSTIVWTRANLDRFLAKPQALVPGTTMAFSGLPNAKDRQDLIAYLDGLGK